MRDNSMTWLAALESSEAKKEIFYKGDSTENRKLHNKIKRLKETQK